MIYHKRDATIASFCNEFGIENLPAGGGLGFLEGDAIKSAADLGIPLVGVGLLYSRGNFHQKLSEDGWQTEWYRRFDPTGKMTLLQTDVSVDIEGREVRLNAWQYNHVGENSIVPILYIDTDGNNHNRPWDDNICNELYPGEWYWKLTQFQVLGKGGVKTLKNLGYDIKVYHLNEGHPALACLEILREEKCINKTRKKIVSTTHTSVPAGIPEFSKEQTEQVLGCDFIEKNSIKELTGVDYLNMTRLMFSLSENSYAVGHLHEIVSKHKFNDYPNIKNLYHIDNGVHIQTWASPEVQKLFDTLTNREWRINPKSLEKIISLSDRDVWNSHIRSRQRLGEFIQRGLDGQEPRVKGNSSFKEDKLTIGYARRMAGYKQANLMFDDINQLAELGKDIQIIISGKSHPSDNHGKNIIKDIFLKKKELDGKVSIWFLEDYDMEIGKYLVRGVDLWLNNPQLFEEASGTSGMKAAANFIPQFSGLDGWAYPREPAKGYLFPRGLIDGVTGWSLGRMPTKEDLLLFFSENGNKIREQERKKCSEDFYDKLKYEIIPLFKNHKIKLGKEKSYTKIMKQACAYNASWFNTHRMVRERCEKAYGVKAFV
jgi:starch phosphorylase